MLRLFGAAIVQWIEDILARRNHPPGARLPGCSHHGDAPAVRTHA